MTTAASYAALFDGHLKGLLQWRQFDDLWALLRGQPEGWYVRDFPSKKVPSKPMPADEFLTFLDEAEAFLRQRHREDYCGFIYVDDVENPNFIKVFDPRKMGSACGCGGPVSPRWTISRQTPLLASEMGEGDPICRPSKQKTGLLARLFGH